MKCNQSRAGFELVSPCPFSTTITITLRAPLSPIALTAPLSCYSSDRLSKTNNNEWNTRVSQMVCNILVCTNLWHIGLMSKVFASGLETRVQSQVASYQGLKKWYLRPPCLALSTIRLGSRVKWCNPGNGVAPSPTPRCNSYRNESLRVTFDWSRQLYFLLYYKTEVVQAEVGSIVVVIVLTFILCVIWKPQRWMCNSDLYSSNSNLAINPQRQSKTFVVKKVKV